MFANVTNSQAGDASGLRPRRACRNCAQVKERCVPVEGDTICQRCHRLHKECTTPLPAVRGRQSRPQRHQQQHAQSPQSPQSPQSLRSSYSQSRHPTKSIGHPVGVPISTPPSTLQTPAPSDHYCAPNYWNLYAEVGSEATVPSATLAGIEAAKQTALATDYEASMATFFPFVATNIASADPAAQPFTHATMLVAALHRHPALQKQAGNEVLRFLGATLLAEGHKSLDLLQGVMLLVSWYPYYSHRNPQLMNLQHLAQALLIDLGLTKPHGAPSLPYTVATRIPELLHGAGVSTEHNSLPDCRALLAGYYIGAQLAVNLRRLDHPRWTDHMERCCCTLDKAGNDVDAMGRNDALAAHLLRLHVAAEPYLVADGIRPHGLGGASTSAKPGARAAEQLPVRIYVQSFHADLERARHTAPLHLGEHWFVRMHKTALEIALYDAVATAVIAEDMSVSSTTSSAEHLEALDSLLGRLSSMLDIACSIPVEQCACLPVLAWSMLGQATDVLARVSFLKLSGWDLRRVRSQVNLGDYVERLSDHMMAVFMCERRRFPLLDANRFATFMLKLRQLRKWFEEKVAKDEANLVEVEGSGFPGRCFTGDGGDTLFSEAFWSFGAEELQWL